MSSVTTSQASSTAAVPPISPSRPPWNYDYSEVLQSPGTGYHGQPGRGDKNSNGYDAMQIRKTKFSLDASIAIVGLPGVGKSTLGVIASTCRKMRLVETDRCFNTMTGLTGPDYLREHGKRALLAKEFEVLQSILRKHSKNCVIAVATRTADISSCRRLLEEFGKSHPIIHIMRDRRHLVQHLEGRMTPEEAMKMYYRSVPRCRSLANFEFFIHDLAEKVAGLRSRPVPHFLFLKDVERTFLGFLRFINGEPRYPTFLRPPEDTEFSRIMSVQFPRDNIHPSDCGTTHNVHAVKLELDFQDVDNTQWDLLLSRMSAVSATLRDSCDIPLAFNVQNAFGPTQSTLLDEGKYFGLLEHAVSLGFDYCYLDLHTSRRRAMEFVSKAATTKIVGYWHHTSSSRTDDVRSWWTTPDPLSVFWIGVDLGCAVVQLSAKAMLIQDNFDLVQFINNVTRTGPPRGPKISAFNTGATGRLSRVLNRTLNPVIRSSTEGTRAPEPRTQNTELDSIITIAEAQNALASSFVIKGLRFGSFGAVISHSVGPAIHNAAFSALGLPHRYEFTESADLSDSLRIMRSQDFGGLSCANPHKQTIIHLLDGISDDARAIKAVNTVYPRESPSSDRTLLFGENTDWIGIKSAVKNYLSPINIVTTKTTALVIGAGGMAHAAVYGLLRLGVGKIFLHNRTPEHAEELVRHFQQVIRTLEEKKETRGLEDVPSVTGCNLVVVRSVNEPNVFSNEMNPPTIVINTLPDEVETPISSTFDLPLSWFSHATGGVYIETAYKIGNSTLKQKIIGLASRNWIGIGGQELLVEQALPQIELWTGMLAPRHIMRKAIGL